MSTHTKRQIKRLTNGWKDEQKKLSGSYKNQHSLDNDGHLDIKYLYYPHEEGAIV